MILQSKKNVNQFSVFQCHHNNRAWATSGSANKVQCDVQKFNAVWLGFLSQNKTSIRLVCSGIIKQLCLGNFGFSELNAILRPGNSMQLDSHFIDKSKRQSVVCDSQGGLEEPQRKRGSENVEKALISIVFFKSGIKIVENAVVFIVCLQI